ncbi:hypothetical protein [Streptomyces sp. CA-146814]
MDDVEAGPGGAMADESGGPVPLYPAGPEALHREIFDRIRRRGGAQAAP